MAISDRIGIVIFAAASAVTAALGLWQLRRRQDKIAQIGDRRARLTNRPSPIDAGSPPPAYSRVVLPPGLTYRGPQQFLVGPRAGPASPTRPGTRTGLASGAGLGYYLIAPYTLPDGRLVLVNRGWCRRDHVRPALESIDDDRVAGSAGIVRPSEYSSADVTPSADSNVFVRMDAEEMSLRADPGQLPATYFVDLLDEGREQGVVHLRRRTVDDFLRFNVTPEVHASYASTWFALSAASIIIGALKIRQRCALGHFRFR